MLVVNFIPLKGQGALTKMGPAYAVYLRETFNDFQLNSIKDTIVKGQPIQLMQCSFKLKEGKTELISTIAFTEHRTQLVTVIGTAVRGPQTQNLKNQSIFRQAISSFTWK
ncbi:hypothetical protein B0919_01425 [Hymenobacter sp. CRA2]|nr:hypothetical protein B0919_01425 [Hymenobacter sp. CRA2]